MGRGSREWAVVGTGSIVHLVDAGLGSIFFYMLFLMRPLFLRLLVNTPSLLARLGYTNVLSLRRRRPFMSLGLRIYNYMSSA